MSAPYVIHHISERESKTYNLSNIEEIDELIAVLQKQKANLISIPESNKDIYDECMNVLSKCVYDPLAITSTTAFYNHIMKNFNYSISRQKFADIIKLVQKSSPFPFEKITRKNGTFYKGFNLNIDNNKEDNTPHTEEVRHEIFEEISVEDNLTPKSKSICDIHPAFTYEIAEEDKILHPEEENVEKVEFYEPKNFSSPDRKSVV